MTLNEAIVKLRQSDDKDPVKYEKQELARWFEKMLKKANKGV